MKNKSFLHVCLVKVEVSDAPGRVRAIFLQTGIKCVCVCCCIYARRIQRKFPLPFRGEKRRTRCFFWARVPVKRKTRTNALSGVRGQNSSELCMLEEGGEGGWGVLTPTQAQNLQKNAQFNLKNAPRITSFPC